MGRSSLFNASFFNHALWKRDPSRVVHKIEFDLQLKIKGSSHHTSGRFSDQMACLIKSFVDQPLMQHPRVLLAIGPASLEAKPTTSQDGPEHVPSTLDTIGVGPSNKRTSASFSFCVRGVGSAWERYLPVTDLIHISS